MARLNAENVELAKEMIARYPVPKSALIPLLHVAQEQDGYVADDAMEHIAELVGVTAAEVVGTCTFYEMFKRHHVGKYVLNMCTNISCLLLGGEELLAHAEERLGIRAGGTTDDGMFTIEDAECIAACTEAPCLQVNYRYFGRLDPDSFDELIADLRAGTGAAAQVPDHGTLATVRQHLAEGQGVTIKAPSLITEAPVWLARNAVESAEETSGAGGGS